MKNTLFKSFGALFISLSLLSCDEVKELADVKLDTNLSETISLTIDPDSNTFSATETISLLNDDLETYADKLKSVEITKIVCTPKNIQTSEDVAGSITLSEGGIAFLDESFSFSSGQTTATAYTVSNTAALQAMGQKLLSQKSISMGVAASANNTETLNFDLEITLFLKVVANPLE
ncbi:hypothetical protein [Sediminicola luteus]|uniref:Uncharacterized protein n=1 Tax=Sediminicola luteus TaxID=319238 RepID=A0A2A4G8T1_9FLAO|nr:hypothetical protein [Sediminicola luteus]PCE64396.1 hypothetical protein B7P33_08885 [Sediminicola luteus]